MKALAAAFLVLFPGISIHISEGVVCNEWMRSHMARLFAQVSNSNHPRF